MTSTESFKNISWGNIVGVLKPYMRNKFHEFNEPSDEKLKLL